MFEEQKSVSQLFTRRLVYNLRRTGRMHKPTKYH